MCFGFFKKKKKENYTGEPIIPEHRKEIMKNEKRKEDVKELKKIHKEKKKESVLVEAMNESLSDKRLVDIDFERTQEVSLFKVEGIYSIGSTVLINGFVETGKLKKGMKAMQNQNQLKILEVRKDKEKTDYLMPGQEGTLEVKSKRVPLLKQGDFLEFE